jgi:hypothetical protein
MKITICSECGKRKKCEKAWVRGTKWTYTCFACLEKEEDGYVVCLS